MSTMEDILSSMREGWLVPWGIMMHVVGYHDARGGYHEYCWGCSVPKGISSFEYS